MVDKVVDLRKATLKIEGMSCASCAQNVEKALNKAKGVNQAQVNFAAEKAYVEYESSKIDQEKLVKIVQAAGYDVKEERQKVILKIGGMTCASCAAAVEKALNKTD